MRIPGHDFLAGQSVGIVPGKETYLESESEHKAGSKIQRPVALPPISHGETQQPVAVLARIRVGHAHYSFFF
jgi:hypothetical protein